RLEGDIPSELKRLSALKDDRSDFKWNALYTNDQSLKAFLDMKQSGGTSVRVNWPPYPLYRR
ncbi:MAG: hypothetical protein GY940_37460, partial [bacterium]|nr:hypothetical protein [bacterium]